MARLLVLLCAVGALACAGGCGSEPPPITGSANPVEAAPERPTVPVGFIPDECGTLTGLVTWVGPVPEIATVPYAQLRPDKKEVETRFYRLANAPNIAPFTRGVGGVVVYLRGVEPVRSRPWDLPPVEVEFRDSQIVVKQGTETGRTGFVRCGASVPMRSSEPAFNSLRARGAAFFSLAFPDPDAPLSHTFGTCGRVELTSAAGYFWQAADLFVCDHPYYAVTDADGRFRFPFVPAGTYDLVAWHPNWVAVRTERNPETCQPCRLVYAPPLENARPVTVSSGRTLLANLNLPK